MAEIPKWITYPEAEWETATPEQADMNVPAWQAWIEEREKQAGPNSVLGSNTGGKYGLVITRGGRLLAEIGDGNAIFNSASVAKSFNAMALQLAIDDGLIRSEYDRVADYWTGHEGPESEWLDASHKFLDRGHHRNMTFNHLWTMKAGFPGYCWCPKSRWEDWEGWTEEAQEGDFGLITANTYAHIEPGKNYMYASAGMWRLNQTLTFILGRKLKDYLDERLFSQIGIPGEDWEFLPGRMLFETPDFYPEVLGYGKFVDPPYEIKGNRVQGGGGWARMSPKHLARIGLLVATGGVWQGRRLISDTPLLHGHTGAGGSKMWGWGRVGDTDLFVSVGIVATRDSVGRDADADDYLGLVSP